MRRTGWLLLVVALVGCPASRRSAPAPMEPADASAGDDASWGAEERRDEESEVESEQAMDELADEDAFFGEEAGVDDTLALEAAPVALEPESMAPEEPAPASPAPAPPAASAPPAKRQPSARGRTAPPVSPAERWPDRVVTVWFGTDRVVDASYPGGFGAAPGGELVVGTLDVSIPENHTSGVLERPSLFRLELSEDPERHVVLAGVTPLDQEAFAASLERSGVDSVLVFVHGFWNSFEDGALRSAQLAWDLGYSGAPALYSWGSAGSAVGYLTDAEAVVAAEPHFDAFLSLLTQQTGVREVHVVAHSMGTRLVAETLARRGREGGEGVSELVLAAPDIEVAHFERDLAEPLGAATERLTVYGSSSDQALAVSAQVNAMLRLGDASAGGLSMAGLDGIDATPIESTLDGHSYIARNPSVLADLSCLLAHVPVVDRPWLASSAGRWTFAQEPSGAPCEAQP